MFLNMRRKALATCWMGLLLAVANMAAAGNDLRLADAVKNRDMAAVRALLKHKADVNAPQPDGATALHWAAHWNELEVGNLLIGAGANVNAVTDLGVTPLSLACTNGNAAMVETLLKAGANAKAVLLSAETALMTCARTGSVDAVKALLARGADVNAKENEQAQTALMWAATENQAGVAKILIEHGADVHARSTGEFKYTPLLFAAHEGAMAAARVLLDNGANVNDTATDKTSVLHVAVYRAHWELAHFLLDQGANPNADGPGWTALHWAAGSWDTLLSGPIGAEGYRWIAGLRPGKLELVKALLAHGADPNARIVKAPPKFAYSNSSQLDLPGATSFLLAALAAQTDIMHALVDAKANPLLTTDDKTTPLMAAAGFGRTQSISAATESNALEAVKQTLKLGNDINAANEIGETALHGSAYWGKNSIVQFLVDNGAELNARNKVGATPLAVAEGYSGRGTGDNIFIQKSTADLLRKLGGNSEFNVEGTILSSLSPCPKAMFLVKNQYEMKVSISTDAATEYENGGCTDLKVGTEIRIKGRQETTKAWDGSVLASQVQIESLAR